MKIVIGADLVPTITNEKLFIDGNIDELFGDKLLNKLSSFDYRVFNLEVPLTNELKPIKKSGPNLVAKEDTINAIKKLNVNLFTLANNHIFDQDDIGLNNTKMVLDKSKINYVGVGDNIDAAREPFIINDDNGKKIGIYVCAEHEFSIVSDKHQGANPFSTYFTFDDIRNLKSKVDYVIVLYHGGKEYYRYPSPLLQKRCHAMVDSGADLIITQHSHCIGCKEKYKSSEIIYGQGNFIFDSKDTEFWQTSLLVSIDTDKKEIDYIPLSKKKNLVRLSEENDAKKILLEFEKRSKEIMESDFIQNKYKEFAVSNFAFYIATSRGKSFIGKVINKITKGWYYNFRGKIFSKKKAMILYDCLICEAHYELFVEGLKEKIGE